MIKGPYIWIVIAFLTASEFKLSSNGCGIKTDAVSIVLSECIKLSIYVLPLHTSDN